MKPSPRKTRKTRKTRKPRVRKPYLRDYGWLSVGWYQQVFATDTLVSIGARSKSWGKCYLNADQCRDLGKRLLKAADYLDDRGSK